MKLKFISLLALLLSGMVMAQKTVVEKYGRLQVNGSHVTSETGEKISLAGMSFFWSSFQDDGGKFYSKQNAKQVVDHLVDDWGVSIVRAAIGVDEADFNQGLLNNFNGAVQKARNVIDAAIDRGIYVIADFHTHYAERYPDVANRFFDIISKEYGDKDNLIYEIFNEPLGNGGGKVLTPWPTVKDYASKVIPTIRRNDSNNLIIVGTPTWSQDVDKAAASRIQGDSNLAYTMHFYANTHTQWLRDRTARAMQDGIAIFVTEWGTVDASGNGGFNQQESLAWLQFLRDNNISHLNWSISDKNESASVINPGQNTQGLLNNRLTQSGQFIRTEILKQKVALNTLSVDEFDTNSSLSIYPVPTTSELTISAPIALKNIHVVSLTGQIIMDQTVSTSSEKKIDVQQLAAGTYILSVETAEGVFRKSFVKN